MLDDRARVLFLRGPPVTRNEVECGMTFKPIEIWTYGSESSASALLFYRPAKDRPYRLWMPLEISRPSAALPAREAPRTRYPCASQASLAAPSM